MADSRQTQETSEVPSYGVMVVGMGPVGLTAAFEAARNGNKVLLVEKRAKEDTFLRSQVVVLDPWRKKQLLDMIGENDELDKGDMKFLDSLSHSAEIKLSAVQKFVLRRIEYLNSQTADPATPAVTLQYGTELTSVALGTGTAMLKTQNTPEKQISFNHLVAADGARSPTLDLVNDHLAANQKIARTTPNNMRHLENTYHLGVYMQLSRKDGSPLQLPEREFVSSFMKNKNANKSTHQLYFLRFDKKSHDRSEEKSVKLGFIGEVPKEVYEQYEEFTKPWLEKLEILKKRLEALEKEKPANDGIQKESIESEIALCHTGIREGVESQKEFALVYAKKAAADYLGIPENELEATVKDSKKTPKKDRLKVLAFKGGSQKANKAALQANGHGFYLVGDAYFTPNYPVGHGLNDGLEAASQLGSLPKPGAEAREAALEKHLSSYNQLTSLNATMARRMMGGIRWFRKLGRLKYYVSKLLEGAVEKREKENKTNLRSHVILRDKNPESYSSRKLDEPILKFINSVFEKDMTSWNTENTPEKIDKMEAFLMNHPGISKQYCLEISSRLQELERVFSARRDDPTYAPHVQRIKVISENMTAVVDKAREEIIMLAKKNPNKKDASGRVPLDYAKHDLKLARQLFEMGANPFKSSSSENAYTFAVQAIKHSPFVEQLAQSALNPKFAFECLIACKPPDSALYKAARSEFTGNYMKLIETYITNNLNKNADGLRQMGIDLDYIKQALQALYALDRNKYPAFLSEIRSKEPDGQLEHARDALIAALIARTESIQLAANISQRSEIIKNPSSPPKTKQLTAKQINDEFEKTFSEIPSGGVAEGLIIAKLIGTYAISDEEIRVESTRDGVVDHTAVSNKTALRRAFLEKITLEQLNLSTAIFHGSMSTAERLQTINTADRSAQAQNYLDRMVSQSGVTPGRR